MKANAAISEQAKWQDALSELKAQLPILTEDDQQIDLAFLFASPHFSHEYSQMVADVRGATGARLIIGCSGQAIIGPSREIERQPAVSLLVFSLPGASLRPVRLTQSHLEVNHGIEEWQKVMGTAPEEVKAWFLFADPYSIDTEDLLEILSATYPGVPVVGGLASGEFRRRWTHLFLDDDVYDAGAVAVALNGPYEVRTIVSQGCMPIGQTWTITGVRSNVIESIGGRSAFQVLIDTVRSLPPAMQRRARGNLLIGLAMNEYQDDFQRGDFIIRNLLAADGERGVLAVGALPRMGQTIQFHLRDSATADEDLQEMLEKAKDELKGESIIGALLCSCNGRGHNLFGVHNHDALAVAEKLGQIPLAGLFCNGELGPVGSQNFLHSYTASIAALVHKEGA